MSLLSRIRDRVSDTIHAAEQAAADAAAKSAETAKAAAAKFEERARAAVAEAPAPSATSVAVATQAAVDAARNASKPDGKEPRKAEPGIFIGTGVSAAAGGDVGVGGQVSAGYVLGARGSLKSYGSTGVVDGSVGAAAGGGVEVGLIRDVRYFYGDGYQLAIATPSPVSVNVSFTRDKELAAVSVGVAKSWGAGIFHFDTHTEDTSGR